MGGGGAKEGEHVNNSNSMLLHVHGDRKYCSKSHSTFTQLLGYGANNNNSFIALYPVRKSEEEKKEYKRAISQTGERNSS